MLIFLQGAKLFLLLFMFFSPVTLQEEKVPQRLDCQRKAHVPQVWGKTTQRQDFTLCFSPPTATISISLAPASQTALRFN